MQKHVKIAFDASPLLVNKTGVAYYIERLISRAAQRFPDIEFVGFYYNFLGRRSTAHFPKAPNIRYRPIRLIPSKIVYQLRRWGISPPLELLTKEPVDFVLFGNFWGYPSLHHAPAAPVIHDLTYLDLPNYVTEKNRKDLARFVPEQIARSEFVITVSEFSKQKIANIYDIKPEDILVTPIPPLEPTYHTKDEQDKELARLNIKKPFVLFVGTIEPRKNIITLIDAYEQLPKKLRTSYALVIAGRIGWNCDAEIARIQRAKKAGLDVIHTGYISDKTKSILYETTSVFISASHYEGFGMPVLEAMSYGKPCILSDIPVFREITENAVFAYFDESNPTAIAQQLSKLLQDSVSRSEFGAKAKERAASYKWDDVADDIITQIKQCLDRNSNEKYNTMDVYDRKNK